MKRAAVVVMLLGLAAPATAASPHYDTQYFFAATRALVDDPMATGWKALWAPGTVVVDLASLPFAALLGLGGLRASESSDETGADEES